MEMMTALPKAKWALCMVSLSLVQPAARILARASAACRAVVLPVARPLAANCVQRFVAVAVWPVNPM